MKKNKHIVILAIIFSLLVVFEYMAPKKPDWTPSFKRFDKIPFGCYITFDLLKDIFPQSRIEKNDSSLYLKFRHKDSSGMSYLIITQQFDPQKVSLESLLEFVNKGNKVFVAAEIFGQKFMDTLGFRNIPLIKYSIQTDSVEHRFCNPYLNPGKTFYLKSGWVNYYFDKLDTMNCKSITTLDSGYVNYFRMKYGKGEFFIHNHPFAFTNYNILKNSNSDYVFAALSYLKNTTVVWDDNYKPGQESSTPLRYILSQKALRAAWYTILALALVFLLFSSKRLQRPIPVMVPPENSSLEFAKTLGNLYMSSKNHKDIAKKKYNYWLDFLREEYFLSFENPDNPEPEKIAEKTGVSKEIILKILKQKNYIDEYLDITPETLLTFNEAIENFHTFRK
ncbi:MAG: hypothetical protein U0W24_14545 [Bacteroidales bacterium]